MLFLLNCNYQKWYFENVEVFEQIVKSHNSFFAGSDIGLKFVQLDVPGALHSGESTWLKCLYELGRDELYSVKWYKNNVEFFRYLPSDEPAGQNYELLGVYVNVSLL